MAQAGSTNSNIDRLRHPKYYIDGGDLYFLVVDTYFCVHSYFWSRDSPKFCKEMKASAEAGGQHEGFNETTAIHIRNATPEEFGKFLWIFYNEEYDRYDATVEEWFSILKIACAYEFPGIKDFAILKLGSCDVSVARCIELCQIYNVDERYSAEANIQLDDCGKSSTSTSSRSQTKRVCGDSTVGHVDELDFLSTTHEAVDSSRKEDGRKSHSSKQQNSVVLVFPTKTLLLAVTLLWSFFVFGYKSLCKRDTPDEYAQAAIH